MIVTEFTQVLLLCIIGTVFGGLVALIMTIKIIVRGRHED